MQVTFDIAACLAALFLRNRTSSSYRTFWSIIILTSFIGIASDGVYGYLVNVLNVDTNTDPRAIAYLGSYAAYLLGWLGIWLMGLFFLTDRSSITGTLVMTSCIIMVAFCGVFLFWYIPPLLKTHKSDPIMMFHIAFTVCQLAALCCAFVCMLTIPLLSLILMVTGFGILVGTDFVLRTQEIQEGLKAVSAFEMTWSVGQSVILCGLLVACPLETSLSDPNRVWLRSQWTGFLSSVSLIPVLAALLCGATVKDREAQLLITLVIVILTGVASCLLAKQIGQLGSRVIESLRPGASEAPQPSAIAETFWKLFKMEKTLGASVAAIKNEAARLAGADENETKGVYIYVGDNIYNIDAKGSHGVVGAHVAIQSINNSFNKYAATAGEELQSHLKELRDLLVKTAEKNPHEADGLSRDYETLAAEATAQAPRAPFVKMLGRQITDAVKNVAEIAAPVAKAVKAIMDLFGAA